jgi:hypoxanthine phosphoribosyltransferase
MERIITRTEIDQTVRLLSSRIERDYRALHPLIAVSILDGAFIFTADLLRQLPRVDAVFFLKAVSYEGTYTTGTVAIQEPRPFSIRDAHVLVIEDIIDTGLTLHVLLKSLELHNPASISVCSLLSKPSRRHIAVNAQYIGIEIPDRFVIGYGMDYKGKYRNLPDIWVLEENERIDG